jgi:hypothetical protein
MEVSGQLRDPADLPPRKQPRYLLYTRLGGFQILDVMEKRKISFPCRVSNPDFWAVQPEDIIPNFY